ncbi:unknown [Prevotella sp. CAG:924]|nr:unknown [Prevotella sp. CAG:924]
MHKENVIIPNLTSNRRTACSRTLPAGFQHLQTVSVLRWITGLHINNKSDSYI